MSSNVDIFSVACAGKRFLSSIDSTITLFLPCVITLKIPGLPEMAIIPFKFINFNNYLLVKNRKSFNNCSTFLSKISD